MKIRGQHYSKKSPNDCGFKGAHLFHGRDGRFRIYASVQVEHIGSFFFFQQLKKPVENCDILLDASHRGCILDIFFRISGFFFLFWLKKNRAFFFFAGREKSSPLESPSMCSTDNRGSAVSTILRRNTLGVL